MGVVLYLSERHMASLPRLASGLGAPEQLPPAVLTLPRCVLYAIRLNYYASRAGVLFLDCRYP